MFGGLGALIYILVEVIPDAGLLRGTFQVFPRRKRIKALEGPILDNPSVGNYEELGDLYLDDGQFEKARECFDKVLAKRSVSMIRSTGVHCRERAERLRGGCGRSRRGGHARAEGPTTSARRACAATSWRRSASARKRMRCLRRRCRRQRCPKPSTTMRVFLAA